MTATAAPASLPLSRYPQPDRAATPAPPHIAQILLILDILLRYALGLASALDRLATFRSFSIVARGFGTAKLPLIAAAVRRGTRRILALQRVLRDRAAAGRDLRPMPPRAPTRTPPKPSETAPRHAAPADTPQTPRSPRPPCVCADPFAVDPPELYEAEARRRPVGSVIADICRDLGLSPALCAPLFWNATFEAIWFHRGGFTRYASDMRQRATQFEKEVDHRQDLDWPDMETESIRQTLGGLIGEHAFAAPATPPPDAPPSQEPPPSLAGEGPEPTPAMPFGTEEPPPAMPFDTEPSPSG